MNLDDDTIDELPAAPRKDIAPADLELLTLAARALGARFEEVDGEGYGNLHFEDGSVQHAWNPLQFSGDALELAVTLELDIMPVGVWIGPEPGNLAALVQDGHGIDEFAIHLGDPIAATRRAITRAAAEVGKQRFRPKFLDSGKSQQ